MAHAQAESEGGPNFADEGWQLTIVGDDPAREAWAGTILALSNGAIGVRGAIEERAAATTFLAHAYEQSPIHYHEKLHGFAASTDSRVPVAEALQLDVVIDGEVVDFAVATPRTRRTLDIQRGVLERETRWVLRDGRTLVIQAERLVPLDGRTVIVRRLRATLDGAGQIELRPRLFPAPRQEGQSDDPRIGVSLATAGFQTEHVDDIRVIERLAGSGIGVAAMQRQRDDDGWTFVVTGYAVGREATLTLESNAGTLVETVLAEGFKAAAETQRAALEIFWSHGDVEIANNPRLTATLRLNLFHLFTSTGRDGRSSAAAKGLTGEGYEGHFFWDAEAFVLPALAMTAPELARGMLCYRAATLDAAVANARALDHQRGALYAWRTIEGHECSAHYPSGSAQYHINAAIAFAIGLYVDATGDEAFLVEYGAPMLLETARLWPVLGDWADGAFHLRGVTGPDEYTALVDDNWYTNRMAQKHLRLAVDVARRVAESAPDAYTALGTDEAELADFTRIADAMHLPYDATRELDAQDVSFLEKPCWDMAGTPPEQRPLLLHYHPMTLYRHQVAKQADLVLAMVLAGENVSAERKRRVFEHYEPITTHDSTLSAATFAILANEVGHEEAALRFLDDTAFVDLDDRHGNTAHGIHMAALAGSWMTLVWGFGGFRPTGPQLALAPSRPSAWAGYRFNMLWRGTTLQVEVIGETIIYRALAGPAITFTHHGQSIELAAGGEWTGPLSR